MISDAPFTNSDLKIENRLDDLMDRLTLNEKIRLCHGKRIYWTRSIKRLGIPSMKMTDGPHGIGTGIYLLKKMTYFPVAICRAASWNNELSYKFGEALAEETRSVGRHMILAPGINIIRTPLGGRNFEYQTEDPYLNSRITVELTKGIQNKRISTCIKHFAANNQEYNRYKISTEVSERALQEIYYPAFKASVEEADAWSFMACYNRLNGIHGCEHIKLIRETLMNEWKFRGFLVSDWFATRFTGTKNCIRAGLSLEMPFAICYRKKRIKKVLERDEKLIDFFNNNIRRYLRVGMLVGMFDKDNRIPSGNRNTNEHQKLSLKIAEEGIVLLKNKDNILPLDNKKIRNIALIGPNLKKKHSRGGGSSTVRAKYEITPYKGLKLKCKEKGIAITKSIVNADIVLIFAGLNHGKHMDRENKDKLILDLPKKQIKLINNCKRQNKNTIVILIGGSPIGMNDWIEDVPGVLIMWYAGMEGGNAIANIIFGDINPSGKLPITFPKKLQDSPAHKSLRTYPGLRNKVYYDEDIFVGYRYFDSFKINPLFPFGHGLSYTVFELDNLRIEKSQISGNEVFKVEFDIKNTGKRSGAEVVQLYIQDVVCSVKRPLKELKRYTKVFLNPGEKKKVSFELEKTDLSFFDENSSSWIVENGEFIIHIGTSSKNILLQGKINYSK